MLDIIILSIEISGVIAIGLNFILEATNKLRKDHHLFAILNLYGAATLMMYSWYNSVWLFLVLNGFLVIVGIYGLMEVYKKKRRNKN